ncbi:MULTISPECIES: alpha/beta fold hydrolase [unclassified Lysinibacillus]|uniref:alpha/beta fold hydrolase n=1 Tax=unclassified Lysinibacillus TaxID=2636778 RepID=UPI0038032495
MWTQYMIETPRGNFEYFKTGNGEPICITHQYTEFNSKGNIFAAPFTKHYTVYLINLRGCGNSSDTTSTDDYSFMNSVKDLEAIRISLGLSQWSFAGHSAGGMLGLIYAIANPNSLQKIIVGGLSASSKYMSHPDSIYCKNNPNNSRLLEILNLLKDPSKTLEERRALNKEWNQMSIYKKEDYDNIMSRPNSGKAVNKRLDYFISTELKNYDITDSLKEIEIPSFIYCGRFDTQCPLVFSEEIAMAINNSSLTIFDKSSHNPFVEEEEVFNNFVKSTK